MNSSFKKLLSSLGLGVAGLVLGACSGGSSSPLATQGGFQLVQTNVMNNEVWAINRPLTFTFNADVDFASVNLNTINVQTFDASPAVGTFTFQQVPGGGENRSVIVFQPACPTQADLSDAGLEPGGVPYTITVRGLSGGSNNTVRSTTGQSVATTQTRIFTTPVALDPTQSFVDNVPGAPVPIVRVVGSTTTAASRLEIGGSQIIYFEFDPLTGNYTLSVPNFEVPLNLYSDPASRVAAILEFNQPLNPAASNFAASRLRMEVRNGALWQPIDTEVELIANCSATGATVRLEPRGILPPGDGTGDPNLRVVVGSGFQDVVGQANLVNIDNFGLAPTQEILFSSLTPAGDEADEIFEPFTLSGSTFGSLEDTETLFDAPRAPWGQGSLTSAFEFEGTGGPGGNFDWVVGSETPGAPPVSVFFSTTSQQIVGGPNGAPTAIQNVSNGVLNVRNLIINANAEVSALGVNPFVINATGDVIIRGVLSVNGTSAKNVATLNSGNVPEQGGAGQGGGGRGGSASSVVNNSTPAGSRGFGSFNQPNGGGLGGESQFSPAGNGKDARRAAGGGGGSHSLPEPVNPNDPYPWPFPASAADVNRGLIARQGLWGSNQGTSAVTNSGRSQGGLPGPQVFNDVLPGNNFFGVRAQTVSGETVLTRGEASGLIPGTGGGGGGDACPAAVFPTPNWNPGSDEKGGGGGGGAGALHIRALGRIIITGEMTSDGGTGGVGENTIFLDHIGACGGGGSGGHIILESASKVYLGREPGQLGGVGDVVTALGGPANYGASTSGGAVSIGGQGGPGLIQIHVPRPLVAPSSNENATDVVVPVGGTLTNMTSPTAVVLVPSFSKRSLAQSKWLSIGSADLDPTTGGLSNINFLFGGTEPGVDSEMLEMGEGAILADPLGSDPSTLVVRELDPIIGGALGDLVDGTLVAVANNTSLVVSGAGLDEIIVTNPERDIYLRTPTLLRSFLMRVIRNPGGASATTHLFEVTDASYDDAGVVLTVQTFSPSETLQSVLNLPGTTEVRYQIVPRFFRVSSGGVLDRMASTASVKVLFQAAGATPTGEPDVEDLLQDWTGDISLLSMLPAGDLKFFRFQVEFDLDATNVGLTPNTQKVSLDFLRIPFRF